jgi:pimeloyl-ACP methyl ester carboxylesterase
LAAQRLWIALLLELAIYAAALAFTHRALGLQAILAVALLLSLMSLTRIAIVAATYVFALRIEPRMPALRLRSWLRLIVLEAVGLARVQYLILIDSLGLRPRQSPRRSDVPLVILLHGIYCAGAIWRPILRALSSRLECEFVAPSLTPTSSTLLSQADCFSKWLKKQRVENPNRRMFVVAHSMGGLVVRQYLSHAKEPVHIERVICVSTPFRGSLIARLLRTPIGRDLRPESPVIQQLQTASWPVSTAVVAIASAHDNLVIPASSAILATKPHLSMDRFGHLSLLYSRELLDLLSDQLRVALDATSNDLPHSASR